MQGSATCFSCEVNAGRIVPVGGILYRGPYWSITHGSPCFAPGYLVLWTNRHTDFVGELNEVEQVALGVLLTRASRAIQQVTSAERVYSVYAAEDVRHTHFHLIPRVKGMPNRASLLLKPFFEGDFQVSSDLVLPIVDRLRPLLQDPPRIARTGIPDA